MTNPNWQQPQWQQHHVPQPPARKGMRWWTWVIIALSAVLVLVVGYIAFTLLTEDKPGGDTPGTDVSPTPSPSPSPDVSPVPGGDKPEDVPFTSTFNTWLSDRYADGVGEPWEAEGMISGTSVDRSFVAISSSVGGVVVHDVLTGEAVHTLDDVNCWGAAPAIEGKLYCLGGREVVLDEEGNEVGVMPIGALDIAAGEFESFYNAPFEVQAIEVFGVRDGLIHAATRSELGNVLLAFADGQEIAWQVSMAAPEALDCHLLGEYIGCADLSGAYYVLERLTGEVVLEGEYEVGNMVVWSDGGVIVSDFFPDSYTVQLFDGGEEVHEDVPIDITTAHPGTSLPLEYLFADGLTFDRSGRVVIDADFFGSPRFTTTGEPLPEGFSDAYLLTPAESGGIFFGKELLADTAELIDDRGETIASLPERTRIVDGILYDDLPGLTGVRVHPPAS